MNVIAADGAGGSLFAYSFADLYTRYVRSDEAIICHFICSKEVFELLELFKPGNVLRICHYSESTNQIELCEMLKNTSDVFTKTYCLTPDLFNASPFSFKYEETGITWRMVKQNRFLSNRYPSPRNKNVYLAFQTSQEGNFYPELQQFIEQACVALPDFRFFFADVRSWADLKDINYNLNYEKLKTIPNLSVYQPDNRVADFDYIASRMSYFIGVDGGIMNLAYFLNRERFLVDSRFNQNAFKIRWRQDESDIIPFFYTADQLVDILSLVLKNPELTGFPKSRLLAHSKDTLYRSLIYKHKDKFE